MESKIDGIIIRKLNKHEDNRGWLAEYFRCDEIESTHIPLMGYISMTKPGIVRGPHEHRQQSDFFTLPGLNRFKFYFWDNRENSGTFKITETVIFEEGEAYTIIIPAGVVHAYKNLSARDGLIINTPNKLYSGKNKAEIIDEIRYEDTPDSPFKVED